jgi:glycosyltransferase involved in cell wall biosynthesis
MKKLSICIPTYNRSSHLANLLESLVAQISASERGAEIEVLVSDNCSPDETPAIAEKYGDQIRYWRNTENIGPDANFLKLFGEAEGQYIWLPGDDDAVRDDTIEYILRMIEKHDFDYLYLKTSGSINNEWRRRDASKVSNHELLRRVNIYTTFMTSQVIRASHIKPNIQKARVHLGGFMAYYWIFLEALYNSAYCLISEEREVYPDETENTGGYRFYKVWAESVFDVFRASSFGMDYRLFEIMRSRMFFALLLPITFRLTRGGNRFKFENEDPRVGLRKYFNSLFYRAIIEIYLGAENGILVPIHAAVKTMARITSLMRKDVT